MQGSESVSCAESHANLGEENLTALLESNDTLIAMFDKQYECVYANKAFSDFYQKNSNDIFGHPISDIVGRELFNNVIREQCDTAIHGKEVNYESWMQFPHVGYHFCDVKIKPIFDKHGEVKYFALYMMDETIHQEYTTRLEEMANTDPLTGTYNRRYFIEFGDREFDRAHRYHRPLSLLLFDLNDFKSVNDRFGHEEGDRLLVEICRSVDDALRSSDCFARVGGDEFAIILPEQDNQQAMECALRVRAAIQNTHIKINDFLIEGAASTGIASLQQGMRAFTYLWKTADYDLYSNKPDPQRYEFLHGDNGSQMAAN